MQPSGDARLMFHFPRYILLGVGVLLFLLSVPGMSKSLSDRRSNSSWLYTYKNIPITLTVSTITSDLS